MRNYVASWNASDGLTNTNPRKYASMSINNSYGHTVLEARKSTATLDPFVPAHQSDLNNQTFYWGCDRNNTNCLNGYVEETSVWARPEQKIKTESASHVLTLDTTGPAFLQNNSWNNLQCPSGLDTSKCWIWDMNDLSGNIVDRINGLSSTSIDGLPYYQTNTGLMARGQGRKGINFTRNDRERIYASATAISQIGNTNEITFEFLVDTSYTREIADEMAIFDSSRRLSGSGFYNRIVNNQFFSVIASNAGNYYGLYAKIIPFDTRLHYLATTFMWSGSAWVGAMYLDGVLVTSAVDTAGTPTNVINNSFGATIGNLGGGGFNNAYKGAIYEVVLTKKVFSPSEILARYQSYISTGTYLPNNVNTVSSYKMNETSIINGIGIKDSSGNSNHLTEVTGTPDPRSGDELYPTSTGIVKKGIMGITPMLFRVNSADLTPVNNTSFSFAAWYRWDANGTPEDTPYLLANYQGGTGYGYIFNLGNSNAKPYFSWYTDAGNAGGAFSDINTRDGLPHLVVAKAIWNSGTSEWDVSGSLDGGVFNLMGSIGGNVAGSIQTQVNGALQSVPIQFLGTMILKDYALSDAEVSTMWNAARLTLPNLTYARSNKACYLTGDDSVTGSIITCFAADQVPQRHVRDRRDERAIELLARHDPVVARWRKADNAHRRTLDQVMHELDRLGAEVRLVSSPSERFTTRGAALVMTVGGDGTLLATSHRIGAQPLLGVNSSPAHSVGYFCAGHSGNLHSLIPRALDGSLRRLSLTRMKVTVNDRLRSARVLNEVLFTHRTPAAVSRYILEFEGQREEQRSSGFWIGTAAGSTGAIRSAGGRVLSLASSKLELVVREPYTPFGSTISMRRLIVDAGERDYGAHEDGSRSTVPGRSISQDPAKAG